MNNILCTIPLIYIAIGIVFMFWINDPISNDPTTTEKEKSTMRILTVLIWLPGVISTIKELRRRRK